MQTLDFPIRILEREDGKVCLLVAHEDVGRYMPQDRKDAAKKTRAFCNWIRKQFPHVPTEFRFVNTRQVRYRVNTRQVHYRVGSYWMRNFRTKTVNSDKHFVAYDLTKNELLMIKLAWAFKTQPVRLATAPVNDGSYTINLPAGLRPSDALKQRIANKTRVKLLSTD